MVPVSELKQTVVKCSFIITQSWWGRFEGQEMSTRASSKHDTHAIKPYLSALVRLTEDLRVVVETVAGALEQQPHPVVQDLLCNKHSSQVRASSVVKQQFPSNQSQFFQPFEKYCPPPYSLLRLETFMSDTVTLSNKSLKWGCFLPN